MGTPEFACASLQALVEAGYHIAGVVTAPDKPAGRGHQIKESEVKKLARSCGLKVLQPVNLKSPEFYEELKALNANLGIVVAFRMLPETVWSMPEFGTFNLHASLLPKYRGAAPIHHAIMNGEKETGVTTFFLKHEIDTGDIIMRERLSIGSNETFGELHDKLMILGATLVLKTVELIRNDNLKPVKQTVLIDNEDQLKNAPKIYKTDCWLKWVDHVVDIHNKIRGLSPYPAAITAFVNPDGIKYQVKIYKARMEACDHNQRFGTMETDNKNYLQVYCRKGKINILELQISGKKRMSIQNFLNGFDLTNDWKTATDLS